MTAKQPTRTETETASLFVSIRAHCIVFYIYRSRFALSLCVQTTFTHQNNDTYLRSFSLHVVIQLLYLYLLHNLHRLSCPCELLRHHLKASFHSSRPIASPPSPSSGCNALSQPKHQSPGSGMYPEGKRCSVFCANIHTHTRHRNKRGLCSASLLRFHHPQKGYCHIDTSPPPPPCYHPPAAENAPRCFNYNFISLFKSRWRGAGRLPAQFSKQAPLSSTKGKT